MGAWIETMFNRYLKKSGVVAPYMGAWIETKGGVKWINVIIVAPYMGAWIETTESGNEPER